MGIGSVLGITAVVDPRGVSFTPRGIDWLPSRYGDSPGVPGRNSTNSGLERQLLHRHVPSTRFSRTLELGGRSAAYIVWVSRSLSVWLSSLYTKVMPVLYFPCGCVV